MALWDRRRAGAGLAGAELEPVAVLRPAGAEVRTPRTPLPLPPVLTGHVSSLPPY